MIYIIADDLTGANDTGVQFSKRGYKTHVVIISEDNPRNPPDFENLSRNVDVVVIDTETRNTDTTAARKRIRYVLEHLKLRQNDIIYKKIDSTLRGRIGVELEECMNLLQKDICILTPSYPLNKRITVGGYLLVQDQPLGLSEYYNGGLKPEDASFIPSLLQNDTNFPISRIDLRDVIKGQNAILGRIRKLSSHSKNIVVVDAVNDEQLRNILHSSFTFEGSVLYSGSAGLANVLSQLYNNKKHHKVHPRIFREPVLMVSGTRRSITQHQIAYLRNKIDMLDVKVNVEQIFTDRNNLLERYISDATQALKHGRHMVVYPDPLYHNKQVTQNLISKTKYNFRELELEIRDFLGELTATVMRTTPVRNLVLIGGDTTIGVYSALPVDDLSIVDELLPGIPLSTARFKNDMLLNIVTKAGGFGEEDTLYTLTEKLVKHH